MFRILLVLFFGSSGSQIKCSCFLYKAKQAWQLCQDPTIHLCFQFSALSKCESISPLDDLAFDMYQDPEVAHIIRLLDQKKQDTLRQGNSERSKNLKQAIADLQKVASPPQAEAQAVVLHAAPSFDAHMVQSSSPQRPPLAPSVSATHLSLHEKRWTRRS